MKVKKVVRNTISDLVANELKKIIIKGELKPGDRLPTEQELTEHFGVGRTTIREALKALSAMGLIYKEKQAAYVREISNECILEPLETLVALKDVSIPQIFEARTALELTLVSIAAEKHTLEDLKKIKKAHNRIDIDLPLDKVVEANIQFHLEIARASGNIILIELLTSMVELLREMQNRIVVQAGVIEGMITDHAKIVDAISKRDPIMAREAMKYHLDNALQNHLKCICDKDGFS